MQCTISSSDTEKVVSYNRSELDQRCLDREFEVFVCFTATAIVISPYYVYPGFLMGHTRLVWGWMSAGGYVVFRDQSCCIDNFCPRLAGARIAPSLVDW